MDCESHPISPSDPQLDPTKPIIDRLESLVAFYQQEMLWVYRTRAALETDTTTPLSTIVGDEEEKDDDEEITSTPPPATRWSVRKQSFNLRLDGISSRVKSPGEDKIPHVLNLFESMMEARMESCLRVNRLVKRANSTCSRTSAD
jgi:hypothetical protein